MTDKGFKEKPKSIFDQIPDSFEEFLESVSRQLMHNFIILVKLFRFASILKKKEAKPN